MTDCDSALANVHDMVIYIEIGIEISSKRIREIERGRVVTSSYYIKKQESV